MQCNVRSSRLSLFRVFHLGNESMPCSLTVKCNRPSDSLGNVTSKKRKKTQENPPFLDNRFPMAFAYEVVIPRYTFNSVLLAKITRTRSDANFGNVRNDRPVLHRYISGCSNFICTPLSHFGILNEVVCVVAHCL